MRFFDAMLTTQVSFLDENRRVQLVHEGTAIDVDIIEKGAVVVNDTGKPTIMLQDGYMGRVRGKTEWFPLDFADFTMFT